MKILNPVLVALLTVYIVFCASRPASTAEQHKAISRAPAKIAKTYSPETAPTRKEVLRALLQIQDVGLAASPSCSGVGTEPTDSNIGDYISGFLAEQDSSNGGNSIEVST